MKRRDATIISLADVQERLKEEEGRYSEPIRSDLPSIILSQLKPEDKQYVIT